MELVVDHDLSLDCHRIAVQEVWTVLPLPHGVYRGHYELKRTTNGWQIFSPTFTIQWATGNMNIVTLAAAAAQS